MVKKIASKYQSCSHTMNYQLVWLQSREEFRNDVEAGMKMLAVVCIPVFDTIRVMTMRILRGKSPFSPNKTHLHHLFIDMGFSHLGAALFIILINLIVVLILMALWKLGASVDVQTSVVTILGILVTFGFYKFMKNQQNGGPVDEEGYPQGTKLWHMMVRLGGFTHREDKRFWRTMKSLVDGPLMGRRS